MSLHVDNTRRARASTGSTKGLTADEESTSTAEGLGNLIWRDDDPMADNVERLAQVATQVRQSLDEDEPARDTFRHAAGFEAAIALLQKLGGAELNGESGDISALLGNLTCLLGAALTHRGNRKYFRQRLGGWETLQEGCQAVCNGLASCPEGPARRAGILEPYNSLFKLGLNDPDYAIPSLGNADNNDDDRHHKHTVVYPQALSIAVQLVSNTVRSNVQPLEAEDIEKDFARVILATSTIARTSVRNSAYIWQTGLLSKVLRFTFDDRISAAASSAAHQLILDLAAFGLGNLDDISLLFKQAQNSDLARDLLYHLLQVSKGPAFIQFDLTQHGYCSIEVPSMPRAYPPTTGYSLCAWIHIGQFDTTCHTTLFGAFDASQSCFVLIYIEKDSRQLILQTSVRSSRPSVRFKSTKFAQGKWYHIAIVHRKASDPRASPAALFVDGDFAENIKCAYPEAPARVEEKRSAVNLSPARSPSTTSRTKPVQAFFGTPLDLAARLGRDQVKSLWSLANAHLYASPITDEFVAVLFRLSPRYTGNMQDCLGPLLTYRASAELNRYNELLHPDKSEKSDIVTATESRGSEVAPESRLILSIAASAVIDLDGGVSTSHFSRNELEPKAMSRYQQLQQRAQAVAINMAAPTINEAIGRSYGTGLLIGDPVVVVPRSLDDATWSLAGSLPLVIGLLEHAKSKTAFLQAVKIYFSVVTDNWRISEAMEKEGGYSLLALIIREKLGMDTGAPVNAASRTPAIMLPLEDRQALPRDLLELILEFVGYAMSRPDDSMIVNPMAYRMLLVEYDTFRRCDNATQQLYYEQFVHFVSQNRHQAFNVKRLVRMRVIRYLINAMKCEDILKESAAPIMSALASLVDSASAGQLYKDLAMFVAFGLQDERTVAPRSMRNLASVVHLRQRAMSWARHAKGSRPNTPGGAPAQIPNLSRAELAVYVLQMLTDLVCQPALGSVTRRFNKSVPNRWLLHLLAEPQVHVIELTTKLICRAMHVLGNEFKSTFADRNTGWTTLRSRLKPHWRSMTVWVACFAILLGRDMPSTPDGRSFSAFTLIEALGVGADTTVVHQEVMPTLMSMLEAGLKTVVKDDYEHSANETAVLKAVIQFLSELYSRSEGFRDYAASSRYIQEILFVLYPVLVGSDRLAAATELEAEKNALSFDGQEVRLRPHSRSVGERPPSIRSITTENLNRTPSPLPKARVEGPRRLSAFVMVTPASPVAKFTTVLSPPSSSPPQMNLGNDLVEALLEVALALFIDQICNKKDFQGIGLFLKVPPGFREHQAYFESYVLTNGLSELWNHLKLNQRLLLESRVLTNLARYSQHIAEAVFEGWFVDGAKAALDFTGRVLEYLQHPEIAESKSVRLCSQHISVVRVVFLRITLWRLSELNDSTDESETVNFLDQMNYWQTILFSVENQETLFIRLICYLLYIKLMGEVTAIRLAAARLWRTILVAKPTTSATLLTQVMGADKRHLSTGFMKLAELDDEDFVAWIEENREELDSAFLRTLSRPWEDFVREENTNNTQKAQNRLEKRRDRLRQWQAEEAAADDAIHRFEVSTTHWRANVHAQERAKLARSHQDQHENIGRLYARFVDVEQRIHQPAGLEPASEDGATWQLDETEAVNRMRVRLIRDKVHKEVIQPRRKVTGSKLSINTQLAPARVSDNIMSPYSASPMTAGEEGLQRAATRSRADSTSNSQLLEGGFEIVDDPNEGDDGAVEDKNRKIMTSLQRGDVVQQLYNISRIIGLEACEGLLVIGKSCLYLQDNYFQRSDGEIVGAHEAPEDERDPYVQLISGKDVGAERTKHSLGDTEIRHWTWAEMLSVSKRRFLFRDVSLEVFFTDGRSYLLTCISVKARDELYGAIVGRAPHVHNSSTVLSEDAWRLDNLVNPQEVPQSLGTRFAAAFNTAPTYTATKKWSRGEMSNFQYLMLINTMAGRTFNDLTQYPVFPWVLADYTSEELDLTNPKTFRDLSKPMGCQTLAREAEYRDRYQQVAEMLDGVDPPFHYGTHYSSAMIVASYLIRLQPFVQSYLLLQGGSFDHADRLFDSIGRAWMSASRDNMTDVRELTPEFYFLPEFLVNLNDYDFGAKQGSGEKVIDVELPPWAKGSPYLFIAKHREALESPYVSEHLHQWVDLVFGYKQRGAAAIEATNVFTHLSYQGAKDLDTISDPMERLATIGVIHSFGQTPFQVFQRPHPAREQEKYAIARLDVLAESLVRLPDPLFESDESVRNLTFSEPLGRLLCAGNGRLELAPRHDRFMQWGYADNSIRFFSSNTKRPLGLYENAHIGPILAATLADSKTLITAGADCTIGVWRLSVTRDLVDMHPKTHLFGHRTAVKHLAASRIFSTLLSASADGQVVVWGLNKLAAIRVLLPAGEGAVQAICVSDTTGHFLLCQGPYLLLYTLNGHLLLKQQVCDRVQDEMTCCAFYPGAGNEWVERELVFTGHSYGVANIWAVSTRADGSWFLQLVKRLNHVDGHREGGGNVRVAITAIEALPGAVYTGDEAGRVWEWSCVVRSGNNGVGVRGR
ncbi:hypothetical protein LTR62_003867 [Meristemomyces frigidus]|uniref:Beach-domain-containing protein n=1 Tax=Meristemomyces frigidus TaxID=1508187 RepID=A0AAN7YPF9_9PEZI|nr:hypothetical protein LTR62_003867 [Meristemomyces frigidus]